MKRQSAVIFPDTVPSDQMCIPLVQVFEQLVYCLPVENEESDPKMGHLRKDLLEHSFCTLFAPAPLGDDRDRFMRLINDIRNRKDDYAAQLGHLSLASIPTGTRPAKETKSSIVASLLSSQGIREVEDGKQDMLLWQARLVLKLAELYDEDQYQLRLEIERITDREKGLFSELRSEQEVPSAHMEKLFSSSGGSDAQNRLRLKAWSRVYALGRNVSEVHTSFVTNSADAIDRLVEKNEQRTGIRPTGFLQLSLPMHCPPDATFSAAHQQFLTDGAELQEKLAAILADPYNVSAQDKTFFEGEESTWTTLLENVFPAKDWGRSQLFLYFFPPAPVRQLFLDAFGQDDDVFHSISTNADGQGTIIGLLSAT